MKHNHKNFALLILAISMATLLFVGTGYVARAAGEIKLYSSPSSSTQTTGNQFDIAVRVSKTSSDRVDYADVYVSFPASRLEAISINASGTAFNQSSSFSSSIDNKNGLVRISGQSNALDTPSDVLVATIKFRAKAAGRSDIAFTGDSAVGDLFGPGKVKNYLTARIGSTVTANDPVISTPAPVVVTPPSAQPSPSTPAPDASTTDTPTPSTGEAVNNDSGANDTSDDFNKTKSGVGAAVPTESSNSFFDTYKILAGTTLGLITLGLAGWKVLSARKEHEVDAFEPITVIDTVPVESNETSVVEESNLEELSEPQASELSASLSYQPEDILESETMEPTVMSPSELVQPEPASVYTQTPEAIDIVDELPVPPAAENMAIPVTPTSTVPEPQVPVQELAAVSTSPQPASSPNNDEIPDMFELGEERLRREGYVSNVGPRAPQA